MSQINSDIFLQESRHEHSRLVSKISGLIAKNAKFTGEEAMLIESAAVLHDCGKKFVPKDILLKPSNLTEHEYKIIQSHTLAGTNHILKSIKTLFAAYIITLQHHERLDGKGYAQVTNIHKYAKVVAVADVFDALLAKRAYKESWPLEKVVVFMRENTQKQFEAEYVTALLESIDEILGLYKTI